MGLEKSTQLEIDRILKETASLLDCIETEENVIEDPNEEALKYAKWVKKKAEMRYGKLNGSGDLEKNYPEFGLTVGGLYWALLGTNVGDEINKRRPVVIVRANPASKMCTVVPLSLKRMNDKYFFHIDLEKRDGTAIIEQMKNISNYRLTERIYSGGPVSLTDKDMQQIFEVIKNFYGQPPGWLKAKWREYNK